VLYSWLAQRLVTYLAALRLHLPAVSEGANLASVLEHCLYCASSLARVGMDFSGLLQPVGGRATPAAALQPAPPRASGSGLVGCLACGRGHASHAVSSGRWRLTSWRLAPPGGWAAGVPGVQHAAVWRTFGSCCGGVFHQAGCPQMDGHARTGAALHPEPGRTDVCCGGAAAVGGWAGCVVGSLAAELIPGPRTWLGCLRWLQCRARPGSTADGAHACARSQAGAKAKAAAAGDGGGKEGAADASPPYSLMEHFPLAVLTNGLLGALNELRHCAMLSMVKPMAGLLQAALEQAASTLAHYRHSRSLGEPEAQLFRAAVQAMSETVVPFVDASFKRIYPGSSAGVDAAAISAVLQEALH